jgi:hypothetical protein
MIHRNCRRLSRFGAVATALLLALPALADEVEPEPSVGEEVAEPEAEPAVEAEAEEAGEAEVAKPRGRDFDQLVDLLILRPVGIATMIVGGAIFVPAALMAAPGGPGNVRAAWETFVAPSVERTFMTPLGELSSYP